MEKIELMAWVRVSDFSDFKRRSRADNEKIDTHPEPAAIITNYILPLKI
jgi:hypothetical protein